MYTRVLPEPWTYAYISQTAPSTGRKGSVQKTWPYLQFLLHRLDSVLLAGQIGSGVAALSVQVQDLTVTLLPHLVIRLHRQISMTHPMLHHLHLLSQQLSSLSHTHAHTRAHTHTHTHTHTHDASGLNIKSCTLWLKRKAKRSCLKSTEKQTPPRKDFMAEYIRNV